MLPVEHLFYTSYTKSSVYKPCKTAISGVRRHTALVVYTTLNIIISNTAYAMSLKDGLLLLIVTIDVYQFYIGNNYNVISLYYRNIYGYSYIEIIKIVES